MFDNDEFDDDDDDDFLDDDEYGFGLPVLRTLREPPLLPVPSDGEEEEFGEFEYEVQDPNDGAVLNLMDMPVRDFSRDARWMGPLALNDGKLYIRKECELRSGSYSFIFSWMSNTEARDFVYWRISYQVLEYANLYLMLLFRAMYLKNKMGLGTQVGNRTTRRRWPKLKRKRAHPSYLSVPVFPAWEAESTEEEEERFVLEMAEETYRSTTIPLRIQDKIRNIHYADAFARQLSNWMREVLQPYFKDASNKHRTCDLLMDEATRNFFTFFMPAKRRSRESFVNILLPEAMIVPDIETDDTWDDISDSIGGEVASDASDPESDNDDDDDEEEELVEEEELLLEEEDDDDEDDERSETHETVRGSQTSFDEPEDDDEDTNYESDDDSPSTHRFVCQRCGSFINAAMPGNLCSTCQNPEEEEEGDPEPDEDVRTNIDIELETVYSLIQTFGTLSPNGEYTITFDDLCAHFSRGHFLLRALLNRAERQNRVNFDKDVITLYP